MSDTREESTHGRVVDKQVQSDGPMISDEEMKARLSDELDRLLENATDTDLDVDKLDGLLAALDELDPLPETEALDVDAGLRRLHERLAARENAGDKPAETENSISSETHRANKRTVWKLLLVAAILVLLFAVPAQGNWNLFRLFTDWTSEMFRTGADDAQYAQITKQPLALDETRAYDTVQDMLDAFGVTAPLFPTWVPERFGPPTVEASVIPAGVLFFVNYPADDGYIIMRATEIDPNYARTIESDDVDERVMKINGIAFHLVSDARTEKASWQSGTLDCFVHGTVSEEEMRQMIQSIYGGNVT